jgi:hypothetical protein
MQVTYKGQVHEVVYLKYLGSFGLYGLRSRTAGGCVFPARKVDCKSTTR